MSKGEHIDYVDYIIVGAGSSGCVLAHRLSAKPETTVALFEAGRENKSWKVNMPAALTYNLENNKHNWFYHTEPEQALNNRRLYWPRGKLVGGSSALNAMVYIRGHAKDYDRWAAEGAHGWHYQNVLPYFRRAETYSKGADEYRGDSGPLFVTHKVSDNVLYDAFIEAGVQAGYPHSKDINGKEQHGFGRFDMTIHNGKRCSAATAYLTKEVSQRRSLRRYFRSHVVKILIENKRAVGVMYWESGKLKKCMAAREIIVASGAINSPHLLMLSGIGDANELLKHNIRCEVNLPGVGKNLQDHLEFYMQYECKQPITLYSMSNPIRKALTGVQWFLTKKGLAASSHLEAGAFIHSRSDVAHPDIQYHFLPSLVSEHVRNFGHCHAFQVHVGTMRPESRGQLSLKSSNPFDSVRIQPNYLQTENDIRDLQTCIPLTREIFNQAAFKPFKGRELQPGIDCQSTAEMRAFIRAKADSAYHPCGTCKMGIDELAVVDPSGKVYGVENLRVVDASIMPSNISGNLNAPTIMIAERMSDLILMENH